MSRRLHMYRAISAGTGGTEHLSRFHSHSRFDSIALVTWCLDSSMNDWDDAERRVERAHELFDRGQWEAALHELRAAIAINPYNGSWHYNLGLTYDAMDRTQE